MILLAEADAEPREKSPFVGQTEAESAIGHCECLPARNNMCALHTRQVINSQYDPWSCREVYNDRKEDMSYIKWKIKRRKEERGSPPLSD